MPKHPWVLVHVRPYALSNTTLCGQECQKVETVTLIRDQMPKGKAHCQKCVHILVRWLHANRMLGL